MGQPIPTIPLDDPREASLLAVLAESILAEADGMIHCAYYEGVTEYQYPTAIQQLAAEYIGSEHDHKANAYVISGVVHVEPRDV